MTEPSNPPMAPESRNKPNAASGTASVSSTKSTSVAPDAENKMATGMLKNHSVRNMRLPMMKCHPSTSWRRKGTTSATSPVATAAWNCRPEATAGNSTASSAASPKAATSPPMGMSTATAKRADVRGAAAKFCTTSSAPSMRALARGRSFFGTTLGTTARIAPS